MQTLILKHYPPVIKQIREIQQIAKAEDIEFSKLNIAIKQVIKNMFLFTADETGVQRLEKLLGIKPKKTQSLEERKIVIETKIFQGEISLGKLQDMLQGYSQGIRLLSHMQECELEVITNEDVISKDIIYKIVDEILPLNIYFEVSRELCAGLYVNLGVTTENYVNTGWEG